MFRIATCIVHFVVVCQLLRSCCALASITSSNSPSPRRKSATSTVLGAADDPSLSESFVNRGADTHRKSLTVSFMSVNSEYEDSGPQAGRLEELKQIEAELASQLAAVRKEKLLTLQSRPLCIGIIGFGRFGQFIAKSIAKHGRVVVTSRSDYTHIASEMGVTYVPLSDPDTFLNQGVDVIIVATSILSFESTILKLAPSLRSYVDRSRTAPLIVDVLSVKEHAREVMLQHLPKECDILCTHPMFGPDSGAQGWNGLTFVYERTRIDGLIFDPDSKELTDVFLDANGNTHYIHEDNESHLVAIDRMERFLSVWEEEGCHMVPLSCRAHDEYAANSQFITHLMGRILGTQGLSMTPIDTKGFESVLKLIESTTADSFDLFYGLYKFNQNSMQTILRLQTATEDVIQNLKRMEREEEEKQQDQQDQEIRAKVGQP